VATSDVQPIRVPKTAELIATRIRRDIVHGVLAENDPLPSETAFMEQFGVSRPTLREAYRILESEGLISVRRGAHGGGRVHAPRGDTAARYAGLVLQFQGTSLADIYEARTMLEVPCAGLAARRRTESDLQDLDRLNEAARAAEPAATLDLHHQFHARLIEIAGNQTAVLLANMIDSILDQADALNVASRPTEEEAKASRRAQRTHDRMLELVQSKDAAGAEALWRKHLDEAAKHVLGFFGPASVLEVLEKAGAHSR
jgi:DNA-binding FadR family transcriptional regulator